MSETGDGFDQYKFLDVENMTESSWRRLVWHEFVELRKEGRETLGQARETNGRVTSLEQWRDRVLGALAILTLVVVPIVGWIIYIAAENGG